MNLINCSGILKQIVRVNNSFNILKVQFFVKTRDSRTSEFTFRFNDYAVYARARINSDFFEERVVVTKSSVGWATVK